MVQSCANAVAKSVGLASNLGRDLFSLRALNGLTQEEAAYKAGFSPSHWCNLEHGRRGEINTRTVKPIARALDVAPVEVAAALAEAMGLEGWRRAIAIAQFDVRRTTDPGGTDLRSLVTANGLATWSEVALRTHLAPGELLAIRHGHDLTLEMAEKVAKGLDLNLAQAFHAVISTRDDHKNLVRHSENLWVIEYTFGHEQEGLS